MRSTTRFSAIALAATLTIAACGSDDTDTGAGAPASTAATPEATTADTTAETTADTEASDTTPETTEETAPETTEETEAPTTEPEESGQDVDGDTATADAALLTVADLPAGWTDAPQEEAADTGLDAALAECIGVDGDGIAAADAAAQSAIFTAPEGALSLTQDIGVLAEERDARTVIAFTAEPDVPACFAAAYGELATDVFAGTLADGATVGTAAATRLQVGAAGDATQAIRVTVPVTGDPAVVEITIDHVVVRVGRAVTELTFENRAEATAVTTIDQITAVVAERLAV